ncbi:MAG: hypothetical protein A3E80_01550 [Chlamydiae bacterium RIFCSPHIGHO2_12_FULL_49_9]|nr:MAG: hypothetical protein A3E80_01550 [Chlamydiae bacterium RIFCSPHIGHO2_12_FULL_49_9]
MTHPVGSSSSSSSEAAKRPRDNPPPTNDRVFLSIGDWLKDPVGGSLSIQGKLLSVPIAYDTYFPWQERPGYLVSEGNIEAAAAKNAVVWFLLMAQDGECSYPSEKVSAYLAIKGCPSETLRRSLASNWTVEQRVSSVCKRAWGQNRSEQIEGSFLVEPFFLPFPTRFDPASPAWIQLQNYFKEAWTHRQPDFLRSLVPKNIRMTKKGELKVLEPLCRLNEDPIDRLLEEAIEAFIEPEKREEIQRFLDPRKRLLTEG